MDEHRPFYSVTVRHSAIHAEAAESYGKNRALPGVEGLPSLLSGARKVGEVTFSHTHRETEVTENENHSGFYRRIVSAPYGRTLSHDRQVRIRFDLDYSPTPDRRGWNIFYLWQYYLCVSGRSRLRRLYRERNV